MEIRAGWGRKYFVPVQNLGMIRIVKWLTLMAIFVTAGLAQALDCRGDLVSGPTDRLGIGVLALDENGGMHLGISTYSGSWHKGIVERLAKSIRLKKILWLGELRYDLVNGQPMVLEANETSGFYQLVKDKGFDQGGRRVPVLNSVAELPAEIRAKAFAGYNFDPQNMRLVPELRPIQEDVRHSMASVLMAISVTTQIMGLDVFSLENRRQRLKDFIRENQAKVKLASWLITDLIKEKRLPADEASFFLDLLELLQDEHTTVEEIAKVDTHEIDRLMLKLTRLINPTSEEMPVQFFKLR